MLDNKGFDLWADGYDKSVGLSDEENAYPFAGYKEVLSRIYQAVLAKEQPSVLDIGFGTGTLTAKLYERGCEIWGQDFSTRMIELARAKMPGAHLFQGDFSLGLAEPLRENRYDFIVATYSLHHLTDREKVAFLRSLQCLLRENGVILIGDVAFANRAQLDRCRVEAGDEWDGDEIYFVYDELRGALPALSFTPVSHCAGILSLTRQKAPDLHVIGQTVHGKIDRPAGTPHPQYPDMIYPINYGYVEGVYAGDGEEQDVYVLGTEQPLAEFCGTVIAVYHRTNDAEDKWIVSPDGRDYTDEEILEKIHFQEQYFEGYLIR